MTTLFTRAQYEALPEGYPAQLIDGFLVKEPSPTYGHQRTQSRILKALHALLPTDLVIAAPADVLVDELNVFQPDIVVLAEPPPLEHHYVGVPRLAFEVLSSTRTRDREFKARRLLGIGVAEVWLVDPEQKAIEVVDLNGVRLAEAGETALSHALRGFELVPDELFGSSDG